MIQNKELEKKFLDYFSQLFWQEQEELIFKINKLRKVEK